jgi:S-adenosylmethionine synthetase
MGRYVAKNIVAAGLAERALVQIAYAIGVAQPVSVNVNTFGTEKVNRVKIEEAVQKTIATGASETIWLKSVGFDEIGDQVSEMDFEWSVRLK